MSDITDRIERQTGFPGLVARLAESLKPTDLQSLLLQVYHRRAAGRTPADVLSDYAENRFVAPSPAPPDRLLGWERILVSELPPGFEALALSPVCPLGTASVLAAVSQDWAVSTARNTEVVSDSTNVLALECALRRRRALRLDVKSRDEVHLAAGHRLLRAQLFEGPDSYSHFSTFVLCSAGRDRGDLAFELSALGLHIRFYARALRRFLGPELHLRVAASGFSAGASREILESRLLSPLAEELSDVECLVDNERRSGRGYYRDVCCKVHAQTPEGRMVELIDGGSTDWTQKLLSNAKERLIISGIGSERVCTAFGGEGLGGV